MSSIKYRSAKELRGMFLSYFQEHGSKVYPSFSLVPDDPTLLFNVAGMVPFKPYFLGIKTPEVTRATTVQKCIRTNDIENVGRTARHHTFFEMLGNFSFGDYFKKEIIPWAWEFLTERIGLDPDRLYATIYLDDDEAFGMWRDLVGLPADRIFRLGDEDNFWAAGPTGPCGPCSEIIYDQGPEYSCGKPECNVGCDCDRYLEIWNLVFMQFSRDESGRLTPLPKQNIDTGMGLERLASVVQGVNGDFETDLFRPLIEEACRIAGIKYGAAAKGDLAVRVISDHLRASAFMIADGILPSNEGQGYVLRRIIRRSVRFGRLIGIDEPFLLDLLPVVNEVMSDPYTELLQHRSTIEQVISTEETRFGKTLSQGIELLEDELKRSKSRGEGTNLSGEVAFLLYDTYGFPLELTEEICAEQGVKVLTDEFEREMERQRERARSSSKQGSAVISKNVYTDLEDRLGATKFDGYDSTEESARITAIITHGQEVDAVGIDDVAEIVLENTPFYAERGGQVGDRGQISSNDSLFEVENTIYPSGDLVVHKGRVTGGEFRVGMTVTAAVNRERRDAIRRHHTATHLLHEALTRVLGKHVRQAGSLVTPTFLRFDFNHFTPLTDVEIREVERLIYDEVLKDKPVYTHVMGFEESKKSGVKALFEEKYGDVVRVLEIPSFSTELCGGTHVRSTGEIGVVKIVRDEGIGSGIRRINASCGQTALSLFQNMSRTLAQVSELMGADIESIVSRAEELLDEKRVLEKKSQNLILKAVLENVGSRLEKAIKVGDVILIADRFDSIPRDMLRQLGDRLKEAEPRAVILFAGVEEGQVSLIGMAADGALKKGINAGALVKEVAAIMNGSGGGKPAIGQGGSKSAEKLEEALRALPAIVEKQLQK